MHGEFPDRDPTGRILALNSLRPCLPDRAASTMLTHFADSAAFGAVRVERIASHDHYRFQR